VQAVLQSPSEILADPRRASGPALRAFERIAARWKLSPGERQALLGLPRSTFFKLIREPEKARLSRDTLERISYVIGIYGALQVLLPRKDAADAWVRSPNDGALFKGHSPLDVMLAGKVSDLFVVRRYLDGERGW
jgi:uncharacterized protein (DUF2384 family)